MADYTTELDCVRTFLLKVHTAATTKHAPVEASKIGDVLDASSQRMLVHPPELMNVDGNFYTQRYRIELQEVGEAGLITAIKNILIGISKFNRRAAITGFVYASAPTMCHMKYINSSEIEVFTKISSWKCEIWIDVQWSPT